jgi:hypothetical protein
VSAYRAGIAFNDPVRGGVQVVIGIPTDDPSASASVVVALERHGPKHEAVGALLPSPTIFIPDDIAIPLLNALAAHYGGTADMRTLRSDYLAERERVDLLIRTLIGGGGRG